MGVASLTLTSSLLSPPPSPCSTSRHCSTIYSTSNYNKIILKSKPPGIEDAVLVKGGLKLNTRRKRVVITVGGAISNLNSGGPLISPQDHWGIWTALFATATFGLWSERTKLGSMISAALVTILVGITASNLGIIPYEAPAYSVVFQYLLPLTIPLLLFRADMWNVIHSTGTLFFAFLLGSVATVIGTLVAFLLVPMRSLGQDSWKIAACLMGSYIGGAVNYVAIGEALGVSPSVLAAGVAADNVICAIYFVILFMLASKIPAEPPSPNVSAATEWYSGSGLPVLQTAAAVAISMAICKSAMWMSKLIGFQGGILPVVTALVVILATLLPTYFAYIAPAGDAIAVVLMQALEWSRTYLSNVAGVIAFAVSLVMWLLSFPHYRRKMYEIFYYSHHLYIIYLIFYMLHVGVAYLCLILPGIFLFLIDRYLRHLQSRDNAMLISARLLPCDTIELNFCKSPGLDYKPTSIMSVNVPSISKLQWHPFTITSNSSLEPNTLSIVIKSQGSWSQKLYQHLSSPIEHLNISVEGPYGPTSSHFLRHEALVMISGGSGITPFISIIREVIYQNRQQRRIPKLILVCAFKNSSHLSMLNLLLPLSATPLDTLKIQLHIEAYITQEKENTGDQSQNLLQTISFKPNPSATPITAVLGPNSWLWLSAIITSSFIMFLLLLAFVTRYYIYPFDHYSDLVVYHYSFRILWDMFLVCVCVLVCSSVFFVLQKRRNAKEGKQIQNLEMSNPTSPGGTFINNEDMELESLPHQSIVEATQVHFGARPDLKSILFGRQESDVGVLVCGPRKMRHEVAKICSSGLAKNLQFESISFNC